MLMARPHQLNVRLLGDIAPILPLGRMPNEEAKQETSARPHQYVNRYEKQEAIWALRDLNACENTEHHKTPL